MFKSIMENDAICRRCNDVGNNLVDEFLAARIARREFLCHGAVLGISAPLVAGLAGCADDPSYPLDLVPGAACAYSFRRLRNAYTGAAIQARRGSDSALSDFGFTAAGDWDLPSYHTFIGAGNAMMQKWYDQSGNGNDQVQTSAAQQPSIHSPNYPTSSITGAQGTGAGNLFMTAPDVASVQNIWGSGGFVAIVYEVSGGGTSSLISKGANTGAAQAGWTIFSYNNSPYQLLMYRTLVGGGSNYTRISNAVSISPVRHVVTVAWNSATPTTPAVITLDGVVCTYTNSAPAQSLTSEAGPLMVFNDQVINSTPLDAVNGQLYEVIAWKSQPSAGVQASLINNMRSYFGTP
jgi:hypothetical protein